MQNNVEINKKNITVGREKIATEFFTRKGNRQQIFSLHGAGSSTKERIEYLVTPLLELGYDILRFDFSGHGESSGTINESSLKKRGEEAIGVSALLDPHKPVVLIGSSMGGAIALDVTAEIKNVTALILFAPAVYDASAFDSSFGEGFTQKIRLPGSWKKSTAFSHLNNFKGNLLIIIGTEDEVIPKELPQQLIYEAKQAQSRTLLTIPGCPHGIHRWLQEHPAETTKILSHIKEFI